MLLIIRGLLTTIHRGYFLEKAREDDDCFCLFIADFELKCLYYIDPSSTENARANVSERATHLAQLFNGFLDFQIGEAADRGPHWTIASRFSASSKYPPQQTNFDTGIYVFLFVYFTLHDCPVVFDVSDVTRLRKQLAYWLLKEYLPM